MTGEETLEAMWMDRKTTLEASDDGLKWIPCHLVGKYWHCPLCEVGVFVDLSDWCPNCLAAVRVARHA